MDANTDHGLSDDDFQTFLHGGSWGVTADDNIKGEKIPADAVKRIVKNYASDPANRAAIRGLGLLALMLGVAEWGVEGHELPEDPYKEHNWKSDTGVDSGKHLMSYAIGGVGISHADVGDLEEFVKWVAGSDIVPTSQKTALLRLTTIRYIHTSSGIQYDEVRAAGLCGHQRLDKDLLGEPFLHFGGPVDCGKWHNDNLNAENWQIFRTWMRIALRTEVAQAYLLRLWFEKYWDKTLRMLPTGDDFAEEAMINVRIRNSLPSAANKAIEVAAGRHGTAEKIQAQLEEYHRAKPGTLQHPGPAKRRWQIMMRPIVLYRHFLDKERLVGIGL